MISTNQTQIMALLILSLTLSSCASTELAGAKVSDDLNACTIDRSRAHEHLFGVLWVQTSADYQMAARLAYRQAKTELDAALADTSRTAALEQKPPFADKPPAVILDIDETVLDNSPFQAQLVLDGTDFDLDTWSAWVKAAEAAWVPGAKDFIDYAVSRNVAVIFVTNRTEAEEPDTRRNFDALDYGVSSSPDHLLTKEELDGWGSDKTSRRAYVADNYRILLLIGDDLNDYVLARGSVDFRRAAVEPHASRFGTDWFVIPNPLYGSWERALYERGEDCDMIDEKRSHVRGFR